MFKHLLAFAVSILFLLSSVGCSSSSNAPEPYVENGSKIVYLNDLPIMGEIQIIKLNKGDFLSLQASETSNEYTYDWVANNYSSEIVGVTPPEYDIDNNLVRYLSVTAKETGVARVVLKSEDNYANVVFEFVVN